MINIEDVLKYLKYLKELSRKIGTRVDFSYIEGKRGRKKQELDFLFIEENWHIEEEVELADRKNLRIFISSRANQLRSGKALFLGVGLFKHSEIENDKLAKRQKRLKIFAPLFVVNLEVDDLSDPKSVSLGQTFLNYDLFVKLSPDDEEDNSSSEKHLERVELIKEIEEKMEEAESITELRNIAIEYIPKIKEVFKPELEVKIIKNNEFEESQKDIEYLRSIEDTFYADLCYIFLSNFPSEISTYNSLRLMIEEIEENESFTNRALEKLFSAVFSSKSEKIQEIEKFRLGDLEYYLIQTKTDPNEPKEELEVRRKQIMEDAQEYLRLLNQKRIFENAREYLTDLNTFKQILHYQKVDRIKKAKDNVNWANLLEVFNIWIVDIPSVDRILPMEPELFDLVVVDESSQVNLAQVIPVFYRAKRICVVGDHKQLSLESTGLGFEISNKLDSYTWEKYKPANLSYEEAKEKRITLTKASILDFLRENNFGIPEVMLDEHFRSVPSLARFTNREFYENKLSIMTEKPEYELYKSFKHIETGGRRYGSSKFVIEEEEKVFEIIKSLLSSRAYQDVQLPDYVPEEFTIGVVCFTREQLERIKIRLFEEGIGDRVYAGTPEELQGHEFDVVIISMALDKASNRSKNHYENKNRFNVATSRAKYFTFLVYGGLPENFDLTKRYIAHFSEEKPNVALEEDNLHFSRFNFESELEEFVYERCLVPLKEYFKQEYGIDIEIYNQYKTCGYRLDFVL